MRFLLFPLFFLFLTQSVDAQNFQNLTFGTDSTLEVVSWNIEWFPKNTQTTVNYVTQIIQALDVDVLALQEIKDTNRFKQMVANLDGYSCYFRSGYFAGLAYIYKHDVVEINEIYHIYTTNPYWKIFPRAPMVMDFNFMGENYIVINNHFKCCGDNVINPNNPDDEEYRRQQATNLLKQYIDTYFDDRKVFIVGDLNDVITEPAHTNVFLSIINDQDNYRFADMSIAQGSSLYWSYPSWPSHLDHIIVTDELFDELEHESTLVQTIRLDQFFSSWYQYDQNVSDHRPVGMRFFTGNPVVSLQNAPRQILSVYPNPAQNSTRIQLSNSTQNQYITLVDLQGREIFRTSNVNNDGFVEVRTDNIPTGIYFVSLWEQDILKATTKLCIIR
jgi:exonuclease III